MLGSMPDSEHGDLVDTVAIGRYLGVTRQRADKLSRTDDFPDPAQTLAIGRVWRRADVEAWARRTGRINAEEAG